jgi:hypothetical protein
MVPLTKLWNEQRKHCKSRDSESRLKSTSAARFEKKLGVEVPPQIILGACNPGLAYKALQVEPEISLLLPCNVTVRQDGEQIQVAVIDAERLMDFVATSNSNPWQPKPSGDYKRFLRDSDS